MYRVLQVGMKIQQRATRPLPPRIRESARAEPLLAAAGALLLLEIAIARVWRRRLP